MDWQPAIPYQFLAKPTEGNADTNDCYAVGIGTTGSPFVEWHDTTDGHSGPSVITDLGWSTSVTYPDTVARRKFGIEWLSTAQGYTARFYTGTPESYTLTSEVVNTSVGAQTLATSTDALRIADPLLGAIYRVRLYGTLNGACLRDFYPARDWASGTTMTSAATGEVWSSVSTARGGPGFISATIPTGTGLNVTDGDSATLAFRFTQPNVADVDGELFTLVDRSTGTFGVDADGFRLLDIKIAAFSSDFAGGAVGDGADNAFTVGAHWAAGTHTAVWTINRANTTATLYIDGTSHATADISAVGAMDPSAALTLAAANHHGAAKFDRVLTAAEIARLPDLLR